MRYLTLAEALAIAEAVTGLDLVALAKASRLELLDSALHAPQAGFGDEDFYPDLEQKAAVLTVASLETIRCPTATSASRGSRSRSSWR